ncbi:MAG: DUF1553 domain-containing protein [Planctomycetota bacterium]
MLPTKPRTNFQVEARARSLVVTGVLAAVSASVLAREAIARVDGDTAGPSSDSARPDFDDAELEPVDFDTDVLPILSDHCFHCHGPDAATREADLRLDVHDDVLFVAEPGEPEASELMSRITTTKERQVMPPPEFQKPLEPREVEILRRWIEEGVAWESHWAFEPFARVEAAPPDGPSAWGRDSLDALVAELHRERGLRPAPEAAPGAWLRRVTLDLTGLPPAVETLDAFEQAMAEAADDDERHAARSSVVDELLASRARAEHRTREWLDVARYADTNGYQNDFRRDQWPWRDWVLRAFESNMPYDRFVLEQVAGDLLPDASQESIVATGFQRNHRTVTEAGSIDEEWRVENVADRAETTATAFLGLTLACARCHDHKYDQLTQVDYYRFYAFFNSVDEKGVYEEKRGNVPPVLSLYSENQLEDLAAVKAEKVERAKEFKRAFVGATPRFEEWRQTPPVAAAEGLPKPALERAGEFSLQGGSGPSGSLDLGRDFSFGTDEPFTVSLWLRPFSHGAVYSRMNDDDSYRGVDLVLLESMRPAVHLIHDWPERAIKVVGKNVLERSRWAHVAVVYDGSGKASGVTLLVNGVPQEFDVEADSLDGPIDSAAPLLLGFRRYAGRLDGWMADVRVDDSALDGNALLALAARRAATEKGLPFFQAAFDAEINSVRSRIQFLSAEEKRLEVDDVPTVMVMRDLPEPRETFLLDRGRYDQPAGDSLTPGIPAVFGTLPEVPSPNRLLLGRWLIQSDNPLTARVAVNRIWASFFGVGLVATQDDFGVRGDRPPSQELLDALAADFVASGWDVAALERRIALSATYGQASSHSDESRELDPDGRLLSRGPRLRLDAEMVRDSALFVAGLLESRFGGPSVRPYQPEGLWAELAGGAGQGAYVPSVGADLFRRSVYTYRKRTVPHPSLTTFDAPSFELCVVKRARTNTPLQALATLNDVTYVEAARHLAARMMNAGESFGERLGIAARALLARDLNEAEISVLTSAFARHVGDFEADRAAAVELLGAGATAPPEAERTPEWAAMTLVASTLMNLDEALTKR